MGFFNLLSYPRALISVILFVFYTLFFSVSILLTALVLDEESKFLRHLGNNISIAWGRLTCFLFGIKINAHGTENIPKGGCLFVFNHTSFFDIFVIAALINNVRFGAKIELFKIPAFGKAMKAVGVLPIARDNREEVKKVYQEAEFRINQGQKFALAPEGTRSDSETLKPFKTGPFVFAINAKALVIPVVIKGASKVLPKKSILPNLGNWKSDIDVYFLNPIQTQHLSYEQRHELQDTVFNQMKVYF